MDHIYQPPTFHKSPITQNFGVHEDQVFLSSETSESTPCSSKKYWWWNPPTQSLAVEFFQDTSLHGLKYVGQRGRHFIERVFWTAAFIAGMLMAAYLISNVWQKYRNYPVVVSFQSKEVEISKIPFPAVTICNMNKVQRSYVNKIRNKLFSNDSSIRRKGEIEMGLLRSVCLSIPSFAKTLKFATNRGKVENNFKADPHVVKVGITEFLHVASMPCDQMILKCTWDDTEYECSEILEPIFTDFGKCCTFNIMPYNLQFNLDKIFDAKWKNSTFIRNLLKNKPHLQKIKTKVEEWKKWDYNKGFFVSSDTIFPRHQSKAGKSHGLSLLLNPDIKNYYCTSTDSVGFQVTVHTPVEAPHVHDFATGIPLSAEVSLNIQPELTIADPSINNIDVNKRQCYFGGEYTLRFYNVYTYLNCIEECHSMVIGKECNCVWYHMPRNNSGQLCNPRNLTAVKCMKDAKKKVSAKSVDNICSHCLPLCSDLKFHVGNSFSNLQDGFNLWTTSNETENSSRPDWAENPVSILHIFYDQGTIVPKVRKGVYGVTELFANTGGLMGLCLGFSWLSGVEFIYFCTIRTFFRRKGKMKCLYRLVRKINKGLHRVGRKLRLPMSSGTKVIQMEKDSIPIIYFSERSDTDLMRIWNMSIIKEGYQKEKK